MTVSVRTQNIIRSPFKTRNILRDLEEVFASGAYPDTSKQIHLHYSEKNNMHYAVFWAIFLSPSHYTASDRHHAGTPPHTLLLMTASPLPGRGNSESAACNCCSCSWCCLWLINELLDQRENLRSHWKFWPISLLYPLQALSVYLWIQHNSYQKDAMGKQQQKKKFCANCNCIVTAGLVRVCLCNGCESGICWTKHYCMM